MTERAVVPSLPEDARWEPVTDELLATDGARWCELLAAFEPLPYAAGRRMARWLSECVERRSVTEETHAVVASGRELLGFISVKRAFVEISHRAKPLFELRGREIGDDPLRALFLVSIARSAATSPGFGQILFDYALGLAMQDRDVLAIVVEPDNDDVSRMWRQGYRFRPMDNPREPGLLYLPVDPAPEALWP